MENTANSAPRVRRRSPSSSPQSTSRRYHQLSSARRSRTLSEQHSPPASTQSSQPYPAQSSPLDRFFALVLDVISVFAIVLGCLYVALILAPQAIDLYRRAEEQPTLPIISPYHDTEQGQSISQPAYVTDLTDHGKTLREVLENIRHEDCEFFAAFDAEGNKIFECTSHDPNSVAVPADLQDLYFQYAGHTIAHNHPSADCPFSNSDIMVAAGMQVQETIVVSSNYTYTLTPPEQGWPDADAIDSWFIDLRVLYPHDEELWDFVPIYDQAVEHYTTSICTTDALMELYVQKFGGTYDKAPAPIISTGIIEAPA